MTNDEACGVRWLPTDLPDGWGGAALSAATHTCRNTAGHDGPHWCSCGAVLEHTSTLEL